MDTLHVYWDTRLSTSLSCYHRKTLMTLLHKTLMTYSMIMYCKFKNKTSQNFIQIMQMYNNNNFTEKFPLRLDFVTNLLHIMCHFYTVWGLCYNHAHTNIIQEPKLTLRYTNSDLLVSASLHLVYVFYISIFVFYLAMPMFNIRIIICSFSLN